VLDRAALAEALRIPPTLVPRRDRA
jgi:hypothetical protein